MSNTELETLSSARAEAQKQWNTNPCGALPTESYDRDFFSRVEQDRYRQQYWQRGFLDYTSFSGKEVLEIGIGLGTDLKQFARHGANCHGVDITQRHIELTRLNFELDGYPVDVREADATRLPFADNSIDCVHSFGVLHHIPDVDKVLREIVRVLKPGGVFQSAVYHKYSIATVALFGRALLTGKLFKIGVEGVLATIEMGADGVNIKPYVRLYSKRDWCETVERHGLRKRLLGVRQVMFSRITFLNIFRPLEANLGWYVTGVFVKPDA